MKHGPHTELVKFANQADPLAEQQNLAIEGNDVFAFFKEVLDRFDKHEGVLSKEAIMNAFMMAALSQSDETRNKILDYIKSQSDTLLRKLSHREKEGDAVSEIIAAFPGAMVAFGIRKKGIDAMRQAIGFAVDFILGSTLTRKVIIPSVLLSAEFAAALIKNTCLSYERRPSAGIFHLINSGLRMTLHAASNTLGRMTRLVVLARPRQRIPAAAEERSPQNASVFLVTNAPLYIVSSMTRTSFNPSEAIEAADSLDENQEQKGKLVFS